MASAGSVSIGGRRIDLETFTGTVVDSQMTQYTSSQQVNRPDGTTGWQHSTSYWNQFRVQGAQGKEWSLEVLRSVATVTRGDQVTLFWAIVEGKETDWLAVYNHATEHLGFISQPLGKVAGPPLYLAMLVVCGVIQFFALFGMVQGSFSAWVWFLLFCAPWVWVFRRREAIKQGIRAAIPRPGQAQPLPPDAAPPAQDRDVRI